MFQACLLYSHSYPNPQKHYTGAKTWEFMKIHYDDGVFATSKDLSPPQEPTSGPPQAIIGAGGAFPGTALSPGKRTGWCFGTWSSLRVLTQQLLWPYPKLKMGKHHDPKAWKHRPGQNISEESGSCHCCLWPKAAGCEPVCIPNLKQVILQVILFLPQPGTVPTASFSGSSLLHLFALMQHLFQPFFELSRIVYIKWCRILTHRMKLRNYWSWRAQGELLFQAPHSFPMTGPYHHAIRVDSMKASLCVSPGGLCNLMPTTVTLCSTSDCRVAEELLHVRILKEILTDQGTTFCHYTTQINGLVKMFTKTLFIYIWFVNFLIMMHGIWEFEPLSGWPACYLRNQPEKRKKRQLICCGFQPPHPTILLANIQSLDVCRRTRLSHRTSGDLGTVHGPDRVKNLSGKIKGWGVCFMISNSCTHQVLLLPWPGKPHSPVSTVLATEEIHRGCYYSCVHSPKGWHRAGTQRNVWTLASRKPCTLRPRLLWLGILKDNLRTSTPKYSHAIHRRTEFLTILTLPSGIATNPSPDQLSANQVTFPCCSCQIKDRNWNWKLLPSGRFCVVWTNRFYAAGLFWPRGLGDVLVSLWWRDWGLLRYCNVFHQEVHWRCCADKNPTKNCGSAARFTKHNNVLSIPET